MAFDRQETNTIVTLHSSGGGGLQQVERIKPAGTGQRMTWREIKTESMHSVRGKVSAFSPAFLKKQ